jgi:hypothetical protein
MFPQKAVKIRKVTEEHMPYGVTAVTHQRPREILFGQRRSQRAGLFVGVNQDPVRVGSSVAGGGDFRSGKGIHHSGLTHARAAEEADGQKAFLHGAQSEGEVFSLFTEGALLFRGKGQKSIASKKHPELIELPMNGLGGTFRVVV